MRHGAKKKYGSNECTSQFRQRGCVTGALVRMDLLLLFWVKTYLTQLQLCLAKALQQCQWQWELAARERAQACKDSLNSVEPHMNIQLLLWDFWPMEICSNDSSSRVFRQLSRIDPTVSNTCLMKTHHMWFDAHRLVVQHFTMTLFQTWLNSWRRLIQIPNSSIWLRNFSVAAVMSR